MTHTLNGPWRVYLSADHDTPPTLMFLTGTEARDYAVRRVRELAASTVVLSRRS